MTEFSCCKLEIFIPESHLSVLQQALREADAGHIGATTAACLTARLPVAGGLWPEVSPTWVRWGR